MNREITRSYYGKTEVRFFNDGKLKVIVLLPSPEEAMRTMQEASSFVEKLVQAEMKFPHPLRKKGR